MKRFAPLLTLGAVAVLGAALFVANTLTTPATTPATTPVTPAPPNVSAPAAVASSAPVEPAPPAAPPTPPPPVVAEKAYAGRSAGNEVTVAVAVKDGRAVAYVCDGKKIETWLDGTLVGDQLSLQGANEATLAGTLTEAAALGTVAVAGKQWPYSAAALDGVPVSLSSVRADLAALPR